MSFSKAYPSSLPLGLPEFNTYGPGTLPILMLKATVKNVAFQSALGKITAPEALVTYFARAAAPIAAATAARGTLVLGQ